LKTLHQVTSASLTISIFTKEIISVSVIQTKTDVFLATVSGILVVTY